MLMIYGYFVVRVHVDVSILCLSVCMLTSRDLNLPAGGGISNTTDSDLVDTIEGLQFTVRVQCLGCTHWLEWL
jgi:hypothetical protein